MSAQKKIYGAFSIDLAVSLCLATRSLLLDAGQKVCEAPKYRSAQLQRRKSAQKILHPLVKTNADE